MQYGLLVFLLAINCLINAEARELRQAENFFKAPRIQSAVLNPDGSYVATIINRDDEKQFIELHNTQTDDTKSILSVAGLFKNEAEVHGITWIDNNTIAAQFSEKREGLKDLLDTRFVRYLLLLRLTDNVKHPVKIYQVKTSGWLVHPLPSEPDAFLYAKSGLYSDVYKLQVSKLQLFGAKRSKLTKRDGGQFKKRNSIASVNGYAVRWFFNEQGEAQSALHYGESDKLVLSLTQQEEEPEAMFSWSKADLKEDETTKNQAESAGGEQDISRILPVALANEADTYYGLDVREEHERNVYKVNYQTKAVSVVFQSSAYKIVKLLFSYPERHLVGVQELRNGKYFDNYFLSAEVDENRVPANNTNQNHYHSILQSSIDSKIRLHYAESHSEPGYYYVSGSMKDAARSIGGVHPHLNNQLASELIEDSVEVQGLAIPYLLTMPKQGGDKVALIVMPHGGPIGIFDDRYFDLATAFFVKNGFAVLRVNFRGSGGHSQELKEAGRQQWGKLMLQDIHQATIDVTKRDDIDEQNTCVFGMSYGGYAATMLSIRYPDVYQCAVNVAGVSDVNLFLNSPNATKRQLQWLKEQVGDTEGNYDEIKSFSPVYLAHKVQRPLLILHGHKDRVVDVEHAWRLKYALDKHAKDYEWHVYPDGEHSLSSAADMAGLYARVLAFIKKHTST